MVEGGAMVESGPTPVSFTMVTTLFVAVLVRQGKKEAEDTEFSGQKPPSFPIYQ